MSKNSAQKKKHPKVEHTSAAVDLEKPTDVLPTSEPSMQDYPEATRYNVSKNERIVSGVVGGGLLAFGLPNFLNLPGQLSSITGIYMLTRGVTGYCPIYAALGIDSTPYGRMHHRGITDPHPIQLRQSMSTFRSPLEVFEFCRDQTQVARCFPRVKQVQKIDERRSIWMFSDSAELVSIPVTVEITQETEAEQLTWTAFPDSRYRISGTLQFKTGPHNQETEVIATIHMVPPGGIFGGTLMKWLSPISNDAMSDVLHKMKQLLETGEITTSHSKFLRGIMEPIGGWQNRMKSHLHVRTMQSLANRRVS